MSTKHLYLVFTNAVDGHDDELNEWYVSRHFVDILGLDGLSAAQRFRTEGAEPDVPFRYLVVYEVNDEDVTRAKASLEETARERREALDSGREPRIPLNAAIANAKSFWCVPVTDRFEATD
jgi:hypothetical protein